MDNELFKNWWWKSKTEKKIVLCKDCTFFVEDIIGYINKIPIIVTNNGCTAWGGPMGCKTDPEGWCFLGKSKYE